MKHLRYLGSIKFDICTEFNSDDLEEKLNNILVELSERKDFNGFVCGVKFDKISLCDDGCLEKDKEEDEEY